MIEILTPSPSQMTFGERAAIEGVLSQLRPELAIEIGTAQGGSLERIAEYSQRVHSLDLVRPSLPVLKLDHVTLHTGNSHVELPKLLDRLGAEGRNVDFVLVDGDHSADGVERDVRDLLQADAIGRTVILLHDTLNDEVRAGLRRIDYAVQPKVSHVDLDFIGGHLSLGGAFHHELWGGLGLIVVGENDNGASYRGDGDAQFYDLFEIVSPVRDALVAWEAGGEAAGRSSISTAIGGNSGEIATEVGRMQQELDLTRGWLEAIQRSPSWRVTAPLRALKRAARARSR